MRTISTKLENRTHDKFLELCNDDGKCPSEFLRDLIKVLCESLNEENHSSNAQNQEEIPELRNPTVTIVDI